MKTETENTFRALQDRQPIIPWRCRLRFHRWTSYVADPPGARTSNGGGDWGHFTNYVSHCADCNTPKIKRIFKRS